MPRLNIYVTTSRQNAFQPEVVRALREDGHAVYDSRDSEEAYIVFDSSDSEDFSWSTIDPNYESWTYDVSKYLNALYSRYAEHGFDRIWRNLDKANVCVMVMPCGLSAGLELGYAVGARKFSIVYAPAIRVPNLTIKMADMVTDDLNEIRSYLKKVSELHCKSR